MVYNPKSGSPAAGSVTAESFAPGVRKRSLETINNNFSFTGAITPKRIVEFEFIIDKANDRDLEELKVWPTLQISNALATAKFSVWIDKSASFDVNDDFVSGSPDASVSHTGDTVMTAKYVQVDLSTLTLADGRHTITFAIETSDAAETVSTDIQDYEVDD